jgi:hypothetical protein
MLWLQDEGEEDFDAEFLFDEDAEDLDAQLPFLLYGMLYDMQHFSKSIRVRGQESGHDLVIRFLSDPHYCHIMFRMSPDFFHHLHDTLVNGYGLKSTSKSSSIEALGMFLWMVGAPEPFRQAETIFGRSLDTVHRNFTKVLTSVEKLAADNIKPLDPQFSTIHPRLQEARFKGLFNNCIGAIDGTHIEVTVPTNKVVQYLNRKGRTSQNVMAVVDMDLRFTFVLAGWPGSVHDMRVFNDAVSKFGATFPHPPPGKQSDPHCSFLPLLINTKGTLETM